MKIKHLKVVTLFLISALLLTSCSQKTSTPAQTTGEVKEQTSGVTDSNEEVVLKMAETETIKTFNTASGESAIEYTQIMWVTGTLYARIYNEEAQHSDFYPELAVGDPVSKSDDSSVWEIKVKEGQTFEDGTPITAHSFEYSIKALLDPKLSCRNTGEVYILNNGEKYYKGECGWEEVGFKAIDDYTIQITYQDIRTPTSVRDVKESFASFSTGLVHQATYEKCYNEAHTENSYGTTLDKFVASGAYKPVKWIQGQYTEYEKRKSGSPFIDIYNVDRITINIVTDENTKLQMFENGELDIVIANTEDYDEYPDVYYAYTPDTYGMFVNSKSTTNPVLQDKNFRYAMYWGLDRDTIVPVVYRSSKPSGYHYGTTTTVPDPADPVNKTLNFRESKYAKEVKMDGHLIENNGYNKDLALEYFKKAYEANGNKKIEVEVQYIEDNKTSKAWGESLQSYYQTLFGEDKFGIKLRAIPSALLYENLNREKGLNYEILAAGGIYPNLEKPWLNNNWVSSGTDTYSSQYTVISEEGAKRWDELYYACTVGEYKFEPEKHIIAAAEMEKILYEEATYIPTYTRGNRYLLAENIEILMEDGVGDPFVEFALLQARYTPKKK